MGHRHLAVVAGVVLLDELERLGPPLTPELTQLVEKHPDDVCRALSPLLSDERRDRIETVLSDRLSSVVLVLDHDLIAQWKQLFANTADDRIVVAPGKIRAADGARK